MPIPYVPPPDPPRSARSFHLPGQQPWATDHGRRHHDEALLAFGEFSLFVLMWTLADFERDLVDRCSRCSGDDSDSIKAMVFDVMKQPAEDRCPNCFCTTFEGGWKAKIVRPAMWDYSEERWDKNARGYVTNLTGTVQSTYDFRLSDHDFIFRADGTRWHSQGSSTDRLIDGFGHPSRTDSNLGYHYTQVVREEETSVAYAIPPTSRTELTEMLDVVGEHWPPDFSTVDQIRGPILPEMGGYEPTDYRPIDELLGLPGPRNP